MIEELKNVIGILCVIIFVTVALLGTEKFMHTNETSVEKLTQYLLRDILGFFKGIKNFVCEHFQKQPEYHFFEESLQNDLQNVVSDYAATGLEVKCSVCTDADAKNPARCIRIEFSAQRVYSNDKINEIASLALKKFRNYLQARGLNWKTFSAYTYNKNEIIIYLYFAEFPNEEKFLLHRYEIKRKEVQFNMGGIITDDKLDEELSDVD